MVPNTVHWIAETSETERWDNAKMERTAAKKTSLLVFETLQKPNIFGEQTAAARNDTIAKKIVSGLFQHL